MRQQKVSKPADLLSLRLAVTLTVYIDSITSIVSLILTAIDYSVVLQQMLKTAQC